MYMRVSTDLQDHRRQIHVVHEISKAAGFAGNDVIEYIDQGYSGGNMNRPAFQKLKADIEAGKIQGVIVCDLSRLSRDQIDCITFLGFLREHGVKIFDRNGEVRLESTLDVFVRVAESLADSMLREKRSIDTKEGIKRKQREGAYKGGAPKGNTSARGHRKAPTMYKNRQGKAIDPKKVLELRKRKLSLADIAIAMDTYPAKIQRILARI